MILRRDHWNHGLPIGKRHHRHLFAVQKLFDHYTRTGLTEGSALQHREDGIAGLGPAMSNDDSLPLRQSIGFHDDRRLAPLKIIESSGNSRERLGFGRRDTEPDH